MSPPRDFPAVLDRDFLDIRCRLLDVAAALDRLDRAAVDPDDNSHPDRRLTQIRQAIEALLIPDAGRAETVQRLFSLAYDPDWMWTMEVGDAQGNR